MTAIAMSPRYAAAATMSDAMKSNEFCTCASVSCTPVIRSFKDVFDACNYEMYSTELLVFYLFYRHQKINSTRIKVIFK